MAARSQQPRVAYQLAGLACGTVVVGFMWYAASSQFTGGLVDLAVFAPPSAALGVVTTWSAHAFVPDRFTWHRGAIGALIGGVAISPLVAVLVAFSAAWDRGSFQFVFNAGAWIAIAAGLGVGMVGRVVAWCRNP